MTEGLRVGLLSSFIPPDPGGISSVLSVLLPRLRHAGVEVVVVTGEGAPAEKVLRSAEVDESRRWQRQRPAEAAGLRRELDPLAERLAASLEPFSFDLLNSHTDWVLGDGVAHHLGIPHVATLHGYPPEAADFAGDGQPYRPGLDRVRAETAAGDYAAVATVSAYLRSRWLAAGLRGDIEVIPNPIRYDLFHAGAAKLREAERDRLGMSPHVPLVCLPQRLDKFGLRTLFAALRRVEQARPAVVFLLCGVASVPESVEQFRRGAGCSSELRPIRCSLEEMPGIYAAADVVLLPSPIEPFGLPALEAHAVGTRVVACQGGAYPELLSDLTGTELYPPGDVERATTVILSALESGRTEPEVLDLYQPGPAADRYLDLFHRVAAG